MYVLDVEEPAPRTAQVLDIIELEGMVIPADFYFFFASMADLDAMRTGAGYRDGTENGSGY